ncbi:MAG: ChbG/HpnK family deacetylase [Magnetococcales bacterium]|nr:ChbG/HpnK family deacetylase [Magnetococcales bacterium]
MITIIATADDYGLTTGMNLAIHDLFQHGALSRASAMATGEALEEGLASIPAHHRHRLGAHLCLIEERPVSPPESIPPLTTPAGHPLPRWQLVKKLLLGQIDPAHVACEVRAQLARLRDLGLTIGHVDGHAHLHVWPSLAPVIREVCREFGIHAFRLPVESLSLSWPDQLAPGRLPIGLAISACATLSRRHYATHAPDRFLGLLHSGHMEERIVANWLTRLRRQGQDHIQVEIMFHPAYAAAIPERVMQTDHGKYAFDAEMQVMRKLPDMIAQANQGRPGPTLCLNAHGAAC